MSNNFNELANASKIHPVYSVIRSPTGYRPMETTDLGGGGGGGGSSTVSYAPVITGFTTAHFVIPIGAKEWSILVESGTGFVNNTRFNAGTSLNGGGLNGLLTSGINVGCTGGRILVYYSL